MNRALLTPLASAALGACATTAAPPPQTAAPMVVTPPAPTADAVQAERIRRFQYLYGSGEAGAVSIQTYHALVEHVRNKIAGITQARPSPRPADSVILAAGSTLADPHFVECGDKPFAAVFDVDETVLLNLGAEVGEATGTARRGALDRWAASGSPAVAPVPGAKFALDALREMGVAVIFNTNRDNTSAAGTTAQLVSAGLGPAVHGQNLYLRGDADGTPGKDGRRQAIAAQYCVIAMGGDQLGDFFDAFNARGLPVPERRQAASRGWAAQMWGNGWFMLPNPAYGPSLAGTIDDIFPTDKRWDDTGGEQ
jgi:predicted secreted acid phosphatase